MLSLPAWHSNFSNWFSVSRNIIFNYTRPITKYGIGIGGSAVFCDRPCVGLLLFALWVLSSYYAQLFSVWHFWTIFLKFKLSTTMVCQVDCGKKTCLLQQFIGSTPATVIWSKYYDRLWLFSFCKSNLQVDIMHQLK